MNNVRKGFYILLLVALVFPLFSCGQVQQGMIKFKVNNDYTSVGDVARRSGFELGSDPDQDEVVAFLNDTWANAKYRTQQAGETETGVGWFDSPLLKIPAGQVGVIIWDGKTIVLPPRAYSNIPDLDDEIQKVPALMVPPGQIAWRMDATGYIEHKLAQDAYYVLPAQGWTVEPALNVQPGQMALKREANDTYTFKGPGYYASEIASQWQIVDPVEIGPNEFGIYISADDTVTYLPPAVYYDKLPQTVIKFNRGKLRYRTLDSSVIGGAEDPTNLVACSSVLCDYAITRVVVKDLNKDATVNVDILFHFSEKTEDIPAYRYVGNMLSAVQDNIATPARTFVRSLGSVYDREILRTDQGLADFGRDVKAKLDDRITKLGVPIVVDEVSIRSVDLNDADLRAAANAADLANIEANSRIEAAKALLAALDAEEEVRQKQIQIDQEEEERRHANQEEFLRMVSESGLTWQQLWVIFATDLIDLELYPNGELAAPNAYPLPYSVSPTPETSE